MTRLLLGAIRAYQRHVSPLLPPSCKYTPTCSEYAVDAIQTRGVVWGMALTVKRILSCNPFSRGGYDPVNLPSSTHGMSR